MPNETLESLQTNGNGASTAIAGWFDDEFDRLMEQTERSYAGRKSIPLTDIHRDMEILFGKA